MLKRPVRGVGGARQRGLSLVELLVGVAVGLLIVAGAATVVAGQLSDSRRLVLEAQIQQDLRATADIIVRQVRRAGQSNAAASMVWTPGATVVANPTPAITLVSSSNLTMVSPTGSSVTGYYLDTGPPGVVWQKYGASPAQALTDAGSLNITEFHVELAPMTTSALPIRMACAALCADGTNTCWPTLQPQELLIRISGQASDANIGLSVTRTVQSAVRVRNDQVAGSSCPPLP